MERIKSRVLGIFAVVAVASLFTACKVSGGGGDLFTTLFDQTIEVGQGELRALQPHEKELLAFSETELTEFKLNDEVIALSNGDKILGVFVDKIVEAGYTLEVYDTGWDDAHPGEKPVWPEDEPLFPPQRRYYAAPLAANAPQDSIVTGEPDNNGSSWQDASSDIQKLVEAAKASYVSSSNPVEIWVAAGTYTASSGAGTVIDISGGTDNLRIYGGFKGTETAAIGSLPADRDGWFNSYTTFAAGNKYGTLKTAEAARETILDGGGAGTVVKVVGAADLVFDGFTITRGASCGLFINRTPDTTRFTNLAVTENTGGGIEIGDSNSLIKNASVNKNTAGSGISISSSNGFGSTNNRLVNITVTGNSANNGGGIWISGGGHPYTSPYLENIIVTGNTATSTGGGIWNGGISLFVNAIVSGNTSTSGGALYMTGEGSVMVNTLVSGNNTQTGAIDVFDGALTLINCTVSGNYNSASDGSGIKMFSNNAPGANVKVYNSLVLGNVGNNSGKDVVFSGGIHPILFTASNSLLGGWTAADLNSSATIGSATISAGSGNLDGSAYGPGLASLPDLQSFFHAFNALPDTNNTGDAHVAGLTTGALWDFRLNGPPPGVVDGGSASWLGENHAGVSFTYTSPDYDYRPDLVGMTITNSIPGGVTTDLAGSSRVQSSAPDLGAYESTLIGVPVPTVFRYYAAPLSGGVLAGTAGGNGLSWSTACSDLQALVTTAAANYTPNGQPVEIWAAAGTYTGALTITASAGDHLRIYGGFKGDETAPQGSLPAGRASWFKSYAVLAPGNEYGTVEDSARKTTLDGGGAAVVVSVDGATDLVLDGFTLTGAGTDTTAKGLYISGGTPATVFRNLDVADNAGYGIYSEGAGSAPLLENLSVTGKSGITTNTGIRLTGDIYAAPVLRNVRVSGITAAAYSGIFIDVATTPNNGIVTASGTHPYMENIIVTGNTTNGNYGALRNGAETTIVNAIVSGNEGTSSSLTLYCTGGIYTTKNLLTLVNVLVSGNKVSLGATNMGDGAAGIKVYNGFLTLINCTVSGNYASRPAGAANGAGILAYSTSPITTPVTRNVAALVKVYNSIVAGNAGLTDIITISNNSGTAIPQYAAFYAYNSIVGGYTATRLATEGGDMVMPVGYGRPGIIGAGSGNVDGTAYRAYGSTLTLVTTPPAAAIYYVPADDPSLALDAGNLTALQGLFTAFPELPTAANTGLDYAAANWNFRLKAGSAAVDKGSASYLNVGFRSMSDIAGLDRDGLPYQIVKDLEGATRVQSGTPDLGAYER